LQESNPATAISDAAETGPPMERPMMSNASSPSAQKIEYGPAWLALESRARHHSLAGCNYRVPTFHNPLAFSIPDLAPGQNSAHQFGTSYIGNLRGPDWSILTSDRPSYRIPRFVLQKNFRICESQGLEFRAEFFNLFNHPNFGLPANNPDVHGGNSITSTATDNRQIEFALKYTCSAD
jgi:hypothetical protein